MEGQAKKRWMDHSTAMGHPEHFIYLHRGILKEFFTQCCLEIVRAHSISNNPEKLKENSAKLVNLTSAEDCRVRSGDDGRLSAAHLSIK